MMFSPAVCFLALLHIAIAPPIAGRGVHLSVGHCSILADSRFEKMRKQIAKTHQEINGKRTNNMHHHQHQKHTWAGTNNTVKISPRCVPLGGCP